MPIADHITQDWLVRTFLVGIDLTDDDGNVYPPDLFDASLRAAISMLEATLGIVIDPREFDERYDILPGDAHSFHLRQLDHRPVREVLEVYVQAGDHPKTKLPDGWCHIRNAKLGLVQLIPGQKTYQGYFFSDAGLMHRQSAYLPAWMGYRYTAGLEWNDPAERDDLLAFAIGLVAAMLPLDTAGDLIVGAGIASQSVGFDGLSTSVNTTSSATNAGYGARILSYGKQLKGKVEALKSRYNGIEMGFV